MVASGAMGLDASQRKAIDQSGAARVRCGVKYDNHKTARPDLDMIRNGVPFKISKEWGMA